MPRPCRQIGASAAFFALALATSAVAAAPPRTASLGWTRLVGAESCVAPRALAEAVEARLGRAVFASAARADVAIEARIEPGHEGGWLAMIAITDEGKGAPRTRELRSNATSCRALDEELALVISLMIDPEAGLRPPPGPPPPPAPPAPAPTPAPSAPPPAPPAPTPAREPWGAGQEVGAVLALGLLPGVGGGVTFRERIAPPRWPAFELGGALWFPRQASVAGAGATFSLVEGLVSLCPLRASPLGVDLQACGGVRVGMIGADGFGFTGSNEQQARATFAASVEGRARRRLVGQLMASAGLGLIVPVIRSSFCFDCAATPNAPGHTLFQMSPVAGALDLALGVELP